MPNNAVAGTISSVEQNFRTFEDYLNSVSESMYGAQTSATIKLLNSLRGVKPGTDGLLQIHPASLVNTLQGIGDLVHEVTSANQRLSGAEELARKAFLSEFNSLRDEERAEMSNQVQQNFGTEYPFSVLQKTILPFIQREKVSSRAPLSSPSGVSAGAAVNGVSEAGAAPSSLQSSANGAQSARVAGLDPSASHVPMTSAARNFLQSNSSNSNTPELSFKAPVGRFPVRTSKIVSVFQSPQQQ
jgi:hypothetical protein